MEVEAPNSPDEDLRIKAVDDQLGEVHIGFVRKVFALIGTQILLTVAVIAFAMTNADVSDYLLENQIILVPFIVLFLITALLPVCWKKAGRAVPLNYIVLYTFVRHKQTFSAAVVLTYPCLQVDSELVVAAGILTIVVSVSLIVSVFAVLSTQCAINFQVSTSILYMLFASSITWFLISALVPNSSWLSTGVCALGALLFGVYIVVDTAIILEGSKYGLGNDDYVFAAIMIYLDLMNLFLRILELLAKLKGK